MGMELQKMTRGHVKCDNGERKKKKKKTQENKAYEKLCQQLAVLLS